MRLSEEFIAENMPALTNDFEPLPAGDYTATITQAEEKKTADTTGEYIKIRLDITGPTHQGRVVFANLNTRNASLKAEEIGRAQLGEIMRAVGLPRMIDTDEIVGGHIGIKLAIRPARTDEKTGRTYEPSNEVRGYKSLNAAPPATFGKPIAVQEMPKVAASAGARIAPPWAKKA
jgi:hypothetical protein